MRIDILTLFPEMFSGPLSYSIVKRAQEHKLVDIRVHNIRDYTHNKHHIVDDYPYGGGMGMVLKPEPIFETVEAIKVEIYCQQDRIEKECTELPVILLTPQGRLFHQRIAKELSQYNHLILICGHYEGVDERVREHLVSNELSIGNYVLTGGELAAMVVVDAVVRLLPGVLPTTSVEDDSIVTGLLEYPQYTRPPVYRGWAVPDILFSGNHAQIAKWRRQQAIRRTIEQRPDLLPTAPLSPEERELIERMKKVY